MGCRASRSRSCHMESATQPLPNAPEERPLVTFVLYAFNEEGFVREAVESALAQTYSPLEIVLSDDGSHDRTFAIMEEMTAAYHGPHTIILNRNEQNIGIGSQINAACEKGSGELFILANGDDVSLPERVERTVAAWNATERKATAITTDLLTMDEYGSRLPRIWPTRTVFGTLADGMRRRFGGVAAASLAVSRPVLGSFPPLRDDLILEDNALYLRATLLGELIHLDEPLVVYRIHRGNISHADAIEDFTKWSARFREKLIWHRREGVKAYLQMLSDLSCCRWSEDRELDEARWAGMCKLIENQVLQEYYAGISTLTLVRQCGELFRIILLLAKLTIKNLLPAIELRNARNQYEKLGGRN